ncbi:retrovirus-related pol polyprotein from transposon TNT 1-94 [Tanacetum coccineum]
MTSKSTSSQQSSQLSPSSKVNFKCEDCIIAFNNAVALLEHTNDLYHPLLSFLSNCCIGTALTIQPSAIYIEYLRVFWYTVEVDETAKTITFSLSSFEKPLTFTQDEFIFAIGLPISASFQKPLASEVALTSHMLKVAKIFQEPEQSLILSSEKVNADDGADKSLSGTTVQPLTQPKAPTDLKAKKKKIPPSSKPKSSYKVRVILPKKQVTETQHAEETVAIVDATQSLEVSESVEDQVNQPKTAEAEKESGLESIGDVTFDTIMDEIDQKNKVAHEKPESPYDTESEIKIIKRFLPRQHDDDDAQITFLGVEPSHFEYGQSNSTKHGDSDSDYGLRSMPDDDMVSLTGFETPNSIDDDSQEGTAETFYVSADMAAQSDPLGNLHEELHTLNTKVDQLESSISKKDSIKQSVSDSFEDKLPVFDAQSHGFVTLQQDLSKVIKNKLGVSVRNKVRKGMQAVSNKLTSVQSTMATNSQHVQDLRSMFKDMVLLLKAAENNPPINEENALVLHVIVEKCSEENTSEKNVSDDEPPIKKLKFLIPTSSSILSPTPLKSILPEPIPKPNTTKMTIDQFTEHLNKTTSSIFSPTPLREPTPLRDPTPPRDESKKKRY